MQASSIYNEELTPVTQEHGLLWKREDKFEILGLNGSKARFIYSTLSHNEQRIRREFCNAVAIRNNETSHSFHTQRVCCEHFGFELVNYETMQEYESSPFFKFRQNSSDNGLYFYDEVAKQVANIPTNLDAFFISAGSCQTAFAVMKGFERYGNRPKKIFVIGNKPKPKILFGLGVCYVNRRLYETSDALPPFDLDSKHELEAWRFICSSPLSSFLSPNSLFWVTANYNFLRRLASE